MLGSLEVSLNLSVSLVRLTDTLRISPLASIGFPARAVAESFRSRRTSGPGSIARAGDLDPPTCPCTGRDYRHDRSGGSESRDAMTAVAVATHIRKGFNL
jgi:hypothetical protein